MRKTDFLAGLIFGGLVGSVLVLLYTPNSGPLLRERIQTNFEKMCQEVKNAAILQRAEMEQELAALRSSQKPPEA